MRAVPIGRPPGPPVCSRCGRGAVIGGNEKPPVPCDAYPVTCLGCDEEEDSCTCRDVP